VRRPRLGHHRRHALTLLRLLVDTTPPLSRRGLCE
jgi:hypothetical protein